MQADQETERKNEMSSIKDQPAPTSNGLPAVWDLVIADMKERDAIGRERYGTPLQPFNGRDALVDAYQEALDLAVYLRQAIAERDSRGMVALPVVDQANLRTTCEACGKAIGQNDWDIHTCTPTGSPELRKAAQDIIDALDSDRAELVARLNAGGAA
jgi:hypothetical protein